MGAKGRADAPRSDGAVGFFDSGLGGLCILDAFRALCPDESTIYIADSANCPYGGKPAERILEISRGHVRTLLSKGYDLEDLYPSMRQTVDFYLRGLELEREVA